MKFPRALLVGFAFVMGYAPLGIHGKEKSVRGVGGNDLHKPKQEEQEDLQEVLGAAQEGALLKDVNGTMDKSIQEARSRHLAAVFSWRGTTDEHFQKIINGGEFEIRNKKWEEAALAQSSGCDSCLRTYDGYPSKKRLWRLQRSTSYPEYFYIINVQYPNYRLAKWGWDSTETGVYSGSKSSTQLWKFEFTDSSKTYFHLKNKVYYSRVLAKWGISSSAVGSYSKQSDNSDQMWRLIPRFEVKKPKKNLLCHASNPDGATPLSVPIDEKWGYKKTSTSSWSITKTTEHSITTGMEVGFPIKAAQVGISAEHTATFTNEATTAASTEITTSYERVNKHTCTAQPGMVVTDYNYIVDIGGIFSNEGLQYQTKSVERYVRGAIDCNSREQCQKAALAAGLKPGGKDANGKEWSFANEAWTNGCYYYTTGTYQGLAFWGGSGEDYDSRHPLNNDQFRLKTCKQKEDCLTEASCLRAVEQMKGIYSKTYHLGSAKNEYRYPFRSATYTNKGCYYYTSGNYENEVYFGVGGTEEDKSKAFPESDTSGRARLPTCDYRQSSSTSS